MAKDPISERYDKRKAKKKLDNLAKRGLSTEDVEATEQMLAEAKKERQKDPDKYKIKSGGQVGRNDPCPCGSGKKYKKCCGAGE